MVPPRSLFLPSERRPSGIDLGPFQLHRPHPDWRVQRSASPWIRLRPWRPTRSQSRRRKVHVGKRTASTISCDPRHPLSPTSPPILGPPTIWLLRIELRQQQCGKSRLLAWEIAPIRAQLNQIKRVMSVALCWLVGWLVGEGGLEPPHPFGHRNLNPARLPIPPLARATARGYLMIETASSRARARPPGGGKAQRSAIPALRGALPPTWGLAPVG